MRGDSRCNEEKSGKDEDGGEELVDDFFDSPVWSSLHSGYGQEEETHEEANVTVERYDVDAGQWKTITYNKLTYGEVTIPGGRQLFHHMGLSGPRTDPNEEIVFLDLGSGRGRLVMQTYLELPRVTHSMGIELSRNRHEAAVAAWEELREQAQQIRSSHSENSTAPAAGQVALIEGDFLEADLSKVTHIYISSLCFPDELMYKIGQKLQQDTPPNLQCIATLRAFPFEFEKRGIKDRISYELVYKVFGLSRRTEHIGTTWTERKPEGSEVNVYSKQVKKS